MKRIVFVICLILACLGAAGWYFFLTDKTLPEITLAPDSNFASVNGAYTVTSRDLAGIKQLKVLATQGQKQALLVDKTYQAPARETSETFSFKGTGFADGQILLQITATDGSVSNFGAGNAATLTKDLTLDSTPPAVSVDAQHHIVRQGGAGCVVYAASEELGANGVAVGELFFPGYRMDNGKYVCFYAWPHDMPPTAFNPTLKVVDKAGNEGGAVFRSQNVPRQFKNDKLNLSDAFLQSLRPQFQSFYPNIQDPLLLYLKVNNDLRRDNGELLKGLTAKTGPKKLWDKAFLRLPNAAPRAGFADRRTYVYQNKDVDAQTHLGVDLASLAAAEVPAANGGVVVFTGFLGIYGNAVVIDHGMGVQSLYSHLSRIGVKDGDTVKKGDVIGNTGATGLAGGDHLHFGMMVNGVAVTPIEWWDQHWIDDNVTSKF